MSNTPSYSPSNAGAQAMADAIKASIQTMTWTPATPPGAPSASNPRCPLPRVPMVALADGIMSAQAATRRRRRWMHDPVSFSTLGYLKDRAGISI